VGWGRGFGKGGRSARLLGRNGVGGVRHVYGVAISNGTRESSEGPSSCMLLKRFVQRH
jgi:hypothetical protein